MLARLSLNESVLNALAYSCSRLSGPLTCEAKKQLVRRSRGVSCILPPMRYGAHLQSLRRYFVRSGQDLLENEDSSRSDSECSDSFTSQSSSTSSDGSEDIFIYTEKRVNPNYKFNRNIE
ncbi:hypothetical protein NQ318_009738 [Aromia moschata]|uniref:Uncharacterized protein n=1 Tax=Aromia moschata TaxID=1265417 RepID=A0AAV8Y2U7_9CUCU|nr:hypothetical protein NQ318_009738 [Aromia moschata]